jgi:tetratricopeptide (TPR) repeat protein
VVDEDREDWRRIESVYEQVRFAWQPMITGDTPSPQLFQIVWRLRVYQQRRGIWQDLLAWCERALVVAHAEALVSEEASMLVNIGSVYYALGDKRQALDYCEQSLPLYRQVGDKGGEATALNNIGGVYSDLGDKRHALDYFEQSLPLFR